MNADETLPIFIVPRGGACSSLPVLPSSDTSSKVIHGRGGRAPGKPTSAAAASVNNFAARDAEAVNNFALDHNDSGRIAPRPGRSPSTHPTRVQRRTPPGSRAPVQRSERTTSQEDSCISSTSDRPPARSPLQSQNSSYKMKPWNEIMYYAGFDWAKQHHRVVIVDGHGKLRANFEFEHSAAGWQKWREQVNGLGAGTVAVCVETNQGLLIEQLLESGVSVYPINPCKAKAYRQRKAPSGDKHDALDAWSLADALRVDGHAWRALDKEDPMVTELRLLCRDEVALIEERTALINQLQSALAEYYPCALEAFEDWSLPAAWSFIESFPTPQALQAAGKRRWEKFLHSHKLGRPETYQKRMECFARATELTASEAITRAKSRLALAWARMLRVLQQQLEVYRQQIEKLFAQHPDSHLFGSLPGAGPKLAPRLMSEIGSDRSRFEDPEGLQCVAGTAPVNFRSGQIHRIYLRRQCIKPLRAAVHLWANLSRRSCPWAEVYYRQLRARGKSHACALRCLGQRWLKILWKMWQTHTVYDADLHTRNQLKHGSWVLKMQTA